MKPPRCLLLGLMLFLAACGPIAEIPLPTPTPDAHQLAIQALTGFFDALNRGDYTAAVGLFGDDYEILTTMNPAISASDHVALWKQGCQFNGFQCLKIKEIVSSEQVSQDVFRFTVHFASADGSLFVQGPCCGEDATTMPPVSEFKIELRRNAQGRFQVWDMPPYVP